MVNMSQRIMGLPYWGNAKQWHCPGLKRIECASANPYQIIIALAGGEVIYFELDPMIQNLKEGASKDLKADVCCLDVGTISTGRSRSMFAAVGCRDQTVRIVSLTTDKLLAQLSSIALKSRPQSVSLVKYNSSDKHHDADDNFVHYQGPEWRVALGTRTWSTLMIGKCHACYQM